MFFCSNLNDNTLFRMHAYGHLYGNYRGYPSGDIYTTNTNVFIYINGTLLYVQIIRLPNP